MWASAHMLHSNFHRFFLIILFVVPFKSLRADYGWMPKHQQLFGRFGLNYMTTSENFASDAQREAPVMNVNGSDQQTSISDFRIWAEPEFGIAPDWSLRAKFEFVSNSASLVGGGGTAASGSGLGDVLLGAKYRVRPASPSVVLETTFKFPTYSNFISATDQMLPGDGNIDIGLAVHLGLTSGQLVLASSQELLLRFGGYASAIRIRTAVGGRFKPAYVLATSEFLVPLGNALLFDSGEFSHDAGGTGGSYAYLSGSPMGVFVGLKGGVAVRKETFIELSLSQSLIGKRYPNFFSMGLNLFVMWDFTPPDNSIKMREVPFDSPHENPQPSPSPTAGAEG